MSRAGHNGRKGTDNRNKSSQSNCFAAMVFVEFGRFIDILLPKKYTVFFLKIR